MGPRSDRRYHSVRRRFEEVRDRFLLIAGQTGPQSHLVHDYLPLSAAEEDAVKSDVLAKAGAKDVAFLVDPAILGGLVIKVGDKVLDGSVAGKLEGLRQSLK